jgi:thiol:disulfide interchange protein
MAQTSLWSPRSQRSLPLWLFIVAALLIAGRIVSLQYPAVEKNPATTELPAPAAEPSLVKWVSLSEAPALAKQQRKPIFYDFTAEWCGPCKMLNADVFNDPKLAALLNERFIAVRVTDRRREEGANSSAVEDLQQRFRVQAFPTIVVADAAGTSLETMVGYPGREAVARLLMRSPGS